MIGDFYNYLSIEQYAATDSTYSDDDSYIWSTYTSLWGERVQGNPGEGIYREQTNVKDMVAWRVRFDSGINERMRIYFDGNYYNITGIQLEGRRKYMVLQGYKYLNT